MAGHPWFSSSLPWHTTLDDAQAEAAAAHKRIMLVVGRPLCAGTRALVERTLAKEELEEYTRQHFALLSVEADGLLPSPVNDPRVNERAPQPDPRVAELVAKLPVRAPTPLIAYVTTDGRVVGSSAGGRPPAVLLNDMLGATTRS